MESKHTKAQVKLWLDAVLKSIEPLNTQIKKLKNISDLEPGPFLDKIREQYRAIEIIYNIETGKTSIMGIIPPAPQKAKKVKEPVTS